MLRMLEVVAALRAKEPDFFERWLSGGVQDLGLPVEEQDKLLGWHLGVRF